MFDPRKQRILGNEQRFREINDRLSADLQRLPDDGAPQPFVCECGQADCAETIELSLEEYRAVHADELRFAVVPGHEIPDAEDVVERGDRYFVVRKHET